MAMVTTLGGTDPGAANSMKTSAAIAPETIKMDEKEKKMRLNLPAYSPVIVRVKVQ